LTTIGVSLRPQQYDRLAILVQHQALKGIRLSYEFDESNESGFGVVSLTTTTDPEFMAHEYEDRHFSEEEYMLPA
jgi:SET domain-containing protein